MSTEKKFVKIEEGFVEKGLTLEEAYILGRVITNADYTNVFHETNEEIANAMGKSVNTVKKWINSLVKKGYLRKEYHGRCRMLYSTDVEGRFENWDKKEHKEGLMDGMNLDERVTYLKTMIDQSKFEEQRIDDLETEHKGLKFNDLPKEEKIRMLQEELNKKESANEEDYY